MKWTEERVRAMHARYMDEGATLRELGEEHGISYERVRQLFLEHNLPKRKVRLSTVRREKNEQEAAERQSEIIEIYKEVGSIPDVATRVGLPIKVVRDVINEYPLREAYRRHGDAPAYTPEQIVAAIKTAAEIVGEPLSRNSYQAIAPDYQLPAHYTIERHFGTWHDACEAAGVETYSRRGQRAWSITTEDCQAALRECALEVDRIPSYSIYNAWAVDRQVPSGSTIRKKFGSWKNAITSTFQQDLTVA